MRSADEFSSVDFRFFKIVGISYLISTFFVVTSSSLVFFCSLLNLYFAKFIYLFLFAFHTFACRYLSLMFFSFFFFDVWCSSPGWSRSIFFSSNSYIECCLSLEHPVSTWNICLILLFYYVFEKMLPKQAN